MCHMRSLIIILKNYCEQLITFEYVTCQVNKSCHNVVLRKVETKMMTQLQGRINVKSEELDEMVQEAPGPINFTIFLTMFGEKLKGTDPEETILNAFKIFDPDGKGHIKADYIREMLTTQADRFSQEEITQMFTAFPPDVAGNLDYKNLCYIITHGEEKDQE
ncbi:hypothetical protein XELAEV_18014588mg [Xenopus laevis]|uniref:EF-hand domain-containing protein n=1 Tax=Xenopus laevis TaxID=8355 RepID=A0A974HV38_XENLA|nr:hypothetical protein XELAEV_18014588mg [Xenopus laevis]